MRPIVTTVSALGAGDWQPVDYKSTPANIGLGVVVNGSLTYTVEHTFDDIQDESATIVAFQNEGLTAKNSNDDGNYSFPVRAVRLNVTSYTSGDATLTILQGGG